MKAKSIDRRGFLAFALTVGAGAVFAFAWRGKSAAAYKPPYTNTTPAADVKAIHMSDDAWKKKLDAKAYDVLRCEGTETPFSSALNAEHRAGVFACAGCGLALFTSAMKFDSGTGWPSFFRVIDGHVETKIDDKLSVPRTEYHCAQCGGHQGHVFNDGPAPTGLRFCNNGVALTFVPDDKTHKE